MFKLSKDLDQYKIILQDVIKMIRDKILIISSLIQLMVTHRFHLTEKLKTTRMLMLAKALQVVNNYKQWVACKTFKTKSIRMMKTKYSGDQWSQKSLLILGYFLKLAQTKAT